MSQPVSTMMQRRVRTIDMDDTAADIERLFASDGLSWAPVLDSGRTIIGVISASDLLQMRSRSSDPTKVQAWQICSYKPIVVDAGTPIGEVARLMVERKIHHVVVAEDEEIAGVVSSLDFVHSFAGD